MGLRHGEIYNVGVHSDIRFIWLHIRASFIHEIKCPYDTPQAFAKNWRLP